MYITLLIFTWLATAVAAFSISIEENPTVFTSVPLSWTREDSDPTDFWFNSLTVAADGSLNKVLSLQVSNTGSSSGVTNFVFILTGPHVIQVATDENSDYFNSTTPITAIAATSSNSSTSTNSSSCSPSPITTTVTTVTATTSSTATGSSEADLNAATSHTNSSVVIGATIGTIIPLTILLAVLAVLCLQRRAAKRGDTSSMGSLESKNNTLLPNFTGRRRDTIITPFVQTPDPGVTRTKENPGSQFTTRRLSGSPGPFGEKMFARLDPPPTSPVTVTSFADDTATERTRTSRRTQSSNLASVTGTVPQPTQRQQLLEEEASRLRLQIMSMVNHALSSGTQASPEQDVQTQMAAEMERMRAQIEMLEQDRNSSWARGLSDEPPSYLNSIGNR